MQEPADGWRPIGFFDSGEGGLTVMRAVAALLPGENLLYACDTARFPYGPRPLSEVRSYFLHFLRFFARQGCKLVVVACNTATAAALDLLAHQLPVPTIGVVQPGIRAAVASTRSGRIGVAATQGTCDSGIYPRLIQQARPGLFVLQQPCPILVIRAEEGVISGPEVKAEVSRSLAPFLATKIDTLVLGCTHFPHMQAVIADVMGPDVTLIDPGLATGVEVVTWLVERGLFNTATEGTQTFYTTGNPERFTEIASRLWPGQIRAASPLAIDLSPKG